MTTDMLDSLITTHSLAYVLRVAAHAAQETARVGYRAPESFTAATIAPKSR